MVKNNSAKNSSGKDDPKKSQKQPTVTADIIKSLMPVVVPFAVNFIVEMIPEGTKIDDIMKDFNKYWQKVAVAIPPIIMQFTNLTDIGDDIVAEFSAEVSRALKERYSGEGGSKTKDPVAAKVTVATVRDIIGILPTADFNKLMALIINKDKTSINQFLDYSFGLKQAEAISVLTNLAQAEQDKFDVWFDSCFPKVEPKQPKKPLELDKKLIALYRKIADNNQLHEALNYISARTREINSAYLAALSRPTLLERIGKKLDFFGITK